MALPRDFPLNAVRTFVVAAECGSFKEGAAKLNVTPGAVSKQIQFLEAYLGFPLFDRGYRYVKLTEAGALYFARVGVALAAIDDASNRIGSVRGRSIVRVDCIPTFAMHWLIPRLPEFQEKHPEIEVALATSMGPVDRSGGFDVAIRRDREHFKGLAARKLMAELIVPVASPALRGLKDIRRPEDIARAKLIDIRVRPDLWPAWFKAHAIPEDKAVRRVVLDQTIFAIQAAEEGLGVAMAPTLFVERALAAGRLVVPLRVQPVESGFYHAVSLSRGSAAVRSRDAFLAWLLRTARRSGRGSATSASLRARASRPR